MSLTNQELKDEDYYGSDLERSSEVVDKGSSSSVDEKTIYTDATTPSSRSTSGSASSKRTHIKDGSHSSLPSSAEHLTQKGKKGNHSQGNLTTTAGKGRSDPAASLSRAKEATQPSSPQRNGSERHGSFSSSSFSSSSGVSSLYSSSSPSPPSSSSSLSSSGSTARTNATACATPAAPATGRVDTTRSISPVITSSRSSIRTSTHSGSILSSMSRVSSDGGKGKHPPSGDHRRPAAAPAGRGGRGKLDNDSQASGSGSTVDSLGGNNNKKMAHRPAAVGGSETNSSSSSATPSFTSPTSPMEKKNCASTSTSKLSNTGKVSGEGEEHFTAEEGEVEEEVEQGCPINGEQTENSSSISRPAEQMGVADKQSAPSSSLSSSTSESDSVGSRRLDSEDSSSSSSEDSVASDHYDNANPSSSHHTRIALSNGSMISPSLLAEDKGDKDEVEGDKASFSGVRRGTVKGEGVDSAPITATNVLWKEKEGKGAGSKPSSDVSPPPTVPSPHGDTPMKNSSIVQRLMKEDEKESRVMNVIVPPRDGVEKKKEVNENSDDDGESKHESPKEQKPNNKLAQEYEDDYEEEGEEEEEKTKEEEEEDREESKSDGYDEDEDDEDESIADPYFRDRRRRAAFASQSSGFMELQRFVAFDEAGPSSNRSSKSNPQSTEPSSQQSTPVSAREVAPFCQRKTSMRESGGSASSEKMSIKTKKGSEIRHELQEGKKDVPPPEKGRKAAEEAKKDEMAKGAKEEVVIVEGGEEENDKRARGNAGMMMGANKDQEEEEDSSSVFSTISQHLALHGGGGGVRHSAVGHVSGSPNDTPPSGGDSSNGSSISATLAGLPSERIKQVQQHKGGGGVGGAVSPVFLSSALPLPTTASSSLGMPATTPGVPESGNGSTAHPSPSPANLSQTPLPLSAGGAHTPPPSSAISSWIKTSTMTGEITPTTTALGAGGGTHMPASSIFSRLPPPKNALSEKEIKEQREREWRLDELRETSKAVERLVGAFATLKGYPPGSGGKEGATREGSATKYAPPHPLPSSSTTSRHIVEDLAHTSLYKVGACRTQKTFALPSQRPFSSLHGRKDVIAVTDNLYATPMSILHPFACGKHGLATQGDGVSPPIAIPSPSIPCQSTVRSNRGGAIREGEEPEEEEGEGRGGRRKGTNMRRTDSEKKKTEKIVEDVIRDIVVVMLSEKEGKHPPKGGGGGGGGGGAEGMGGVAPLPPGIPSSSFPYSSYSSKKINLSRPHDVVSADDFIYGNLQGVGSSGGGFCRYPNRFHSSRLPANRWTTPRGGRQPLPNYGGWSGAPRPLSVFDDELHAFSLLAGTPEDEVDADRALQDAIRIALEKYFWSRVLPSCSASSEMFIPLSSSVVHSHDLSSAQSKYGKTKRRMTAAAATRESCSASPLSALAPLVSPYVAWVLLLDIIGVCRDILEYGLLFGSSTRGGSFILGNGATTSSSPGFSPFGFPTLVQFTGPATMDELARATMHCLPFEVLETPSSASSSSYISLLNDEGRDRMMKASCTSTKVSVFRLEYWISRERLFSVMEAVESSLREHLVHDAKGVPMLLMEREPVFIHQHQQHHLSSSSSSTSASKGNSSSSISSGGGAGRTPALVLEEDEEGGSVAQFLCMPNGVIPPHASYFMVIPPSFFRSPRMGEERNGNLIHSEKEQEGSKGGGDGRLSPTSLPHDGSRGGSRAFRGSRNGEWQRKTKLFIDQAEQDERDHLFGIGEEAAEHISHVISCLATDILTKSEVHHPHFIGAASSSSPNVQLDRTSASVHNNPNREGEKDGGLSVPFSAPLMHLEKASDFPLLCRMVAETTEELFGDPRVRAALERRAAEKLKEYYATRGTYATSKRLDREKVWIQRAEEEAQNTVERIVQELRAQKVAEARALYPY